MVSRHFNWLTIAVVSTSVMGVGNAIAQAAVPPVVTSVSPQAVPSVLKVLPSDTAGVVLVNTERKAWESLAQFQLFPVDMTVPGMFVNGLLPDPERYRMRSAQSTERPLAVMNFYVDVLPWLGDRVAYASFVDGSSAIVASVRDASKVQPFLDRLANSRPEKPTQLTYNNAQIIAWAPKPLAVNPSGPRVRVNGFAETQVGLVPEQTVDLPSPPGMPAAKKPPAPPMRPGFALAYLPGSTGHVMVAPTIDELKKLLDGQAKPNISTRADLQKTITDPRFASSLFVGFGDFTDVYSYMQKSSASNPFSQSFISGFSIGGRGLDVQKILPQVYSNLQGFVWATPEGLSAEGSLGLTPSASKVLTGLVKKSVAKGEVLKQMPAVTYGMFNGSVPPFVQSGLSALNENKKSKPFLDNFRNAAKGAIGFDDRDILPWMNGEFAMFAFPTDRGFFAKQFGTDMGIGVLLQTSDRPLAEAGLKKIQAGIIQKLKGTKPATYTINQTAFASIDTPDGKSLFAYSWVNADTVLIVTGAETSDRLVPKPWNPLTESPAFKEAIAPLPKENMGYFYLDGSATSALVFNSIVPKMFGKETAQSPSTREFQTSVGSIRHIVATTAIQNDRAQAIASMKLGRVARPAPTVASLLEKYKPGSKDSLFPGKQGIADMSRAIAIDPTVGEPYFQRGRMRVLDSDYAGALEDFEAAVARNIEPSRMFRDRGEANYYLHNYEKAIGDLEQAIAILRSRNMPEDAGLLEMSDLGLPDMLVQSYMQMGRYQEASNFLQQSTPGPFVFGFYYKSCAAKARSGDIKAASEDCKSGLAAELKRQEELAKEFEKNIAYDVKFGARSKAEAERIRRRRKPELKTVPARCYVGALLGETTALQECEKAIAQNPNNAEAYEYLGLGRAALKQPGNAKQAYAQAIALYETMGNQVAVKRVNELLKLLP